MRLAKALLVEDCKAADMPRLLPRVVPAHAGRPIATDVHLLHQMPLQLLQLRHWWLWIPARASLGRDDSEYGERLLSPSIHRQRNLIVDQRVERGLHIDLGVDHAGLLQR